MLIGVCTGTVALLGALLLWRLCRRRRRLLERRLEQRCKAEEVELMMAVSLQARARSLLAKRTLQQARADKEAREAREAAATRVQALMHTKLKLREMKREFAAVLEAARLEQATHGTSRPSYESSSDLRTDVRSLARMPRIKAASLRFACHGSTSHPPGPTSHQRPRRHPHRRARAALVLEG